MTKPRNRIARKNERRLIAMARLQASLASGVRFYDQRGDCLHDGASRKRALDELNTLTRRIAEQTPLERIRTKKDRSGRLRFSA
jgi:hypothetical protein